ncbi:hypothetical protein A0H81_13399 [Grifola frondosa]|uniref:Uncharacterized protein n=1 Tax=Grifola frondosa TaxID=5627 RepID=A0A1C7LPY5_GRIFR|nr:hypothetical protein A0H81_13399 [Grifola frondosa]
MHPSLRLCNAASKARTPLIRFVGKRQWPSTPEAPQAHPFAPASASSALNPTPAKASAQADVPVYDEFWEAPERLWKHDLEEAEIEAILSGGASLH